MKRIKLEVEISEKVGEMLTRLVRSGLYGDDEAEAAERLICYGVEHNSNALDYQHDQERCSASEDGVHFPGCGCP